jgi:two-component system, NtrC family, nitrogen regulation response regulator GlnG
VMISGESGTGKELVAKALHDYGKRKGGPFVAINMAAIPRDLIESELFGHEKGAFTGAAARSVGRFEQAESGTLFLDEIGDMPMEAQTRLLRVLQQGEYTTVGGRTPIKTNVRIVAATNKDLRFSIQQGTFREDLFFRLNVVPMRLPPLRERPEDIPDLVRAFFQRGSSEGLPVKTFEPAAIERLRRYPWPGNVRELENLTRRLAALYPQEVIGEALIEAELNVGSPPPFPPLAAGDEGRKRVSPSAAQIAGDGFDAAMERAVADLFHSFGGANPQVGLYHRVLHDLEAPLIAATLTWTRGNQIKAAEILGLNRNTLRKKIRDLNLRGVASFR